MRIVLLAVVCLPVLCFSQIPAYTPEQIADRQAAFVFQRAFPFDTLPIAAVRRAAQAVQRFASVQSLQVQTYQWMPVGPFVFAGRCIAVLADRHSPQRWYVGTAAGGVWETTDAGMSWRPLPTQGLPVYAIGALYLQKDTLWAGTGEPNFAYRNYPGDGIYWRQIGNFQAAWQKLAPALSGIISVIASSFTSTTRNHPPGLYKRTTSTTFTRILSGTVTDFAIHPQNSNTIIAVIGEPFGDPRNGVYRTTDGGQTWHKLQNGVPTDFGRAEVSWDSAGNVLYLLVANTRGGWGGLYRSTDQGSTFTQIATAPENLFGYNPAVGQGWYDIALGVSPYDPQQLWIGGVLLYRSTDGGATWSQISDIHVDQHNFAFLSADSVLVVNDGGIYLVLDTVAIYRGAGIISTQFYDIDLQLTQRYILGGTQDNGAFLYRNGQWERLVGGDVTRCLIHPQNPNLLLINTPYGHLYLSTSQGQQWQFAGNGIDYSEKRFWETPLLRSTSDPETIYTATSRVYRSTNGGVHWNPISPHLGGTNIPIVALAEWDKNTLAAATMDGKVFFTRNGGAKWQDITGDSLPYRFPATLAFHPNTDRILVVGYSGYGTRHLWMTTNRGFHWRSIDGNLPDVPVNTFLFDPYRPDSQWYVGTDFGIFYTADAGAHWQPLYNGIGIAPVTDIAIDTLRREIYIATYGMGIWKVGRDAVPISLSTFEAYRVSSGQIGLLWEMQSQDNVDHYAIWRTDCQNGKLHIADVPASEMGAYRYVDRLVPQIQQCDTLTYQLVAILTDGTQRFLGQAVVAYASLAAEAVELERAWCIGARVWIQYRIPEPQAVILDIFTLEGKKVATVLNHPRHPSGHFVIPFALSDKAYCRTPLFVRLRTPAKQVGIRVEQR